MAKWNANEIITFFKLYKPYVSLWNTKHKDYSNRLLKESQFEILLENVIAEGLLQNDATVKQLKAKIKSLKDAFRQEAVKIEKSLKTGMPPDQVYKPKLIWFNNAKFLKGVLSTRQSTSNLDINLSTPDNEEHGLSDVISEEETEKSVDAPKRKCLRLKMKRPFNRPRKIIKRSLISPAVDDTIKQLGKIANTASVPVDQFDHFGKYVAAQIRTLPLREGILLQQEIQNSITNAVLNCIPRTSDSPPNNMTNMLYLSPPFPSTSSQSSDHYKSSTPSPVSTQPSALGPYEES